MTKAKIPTDILKEEHQAVLVKLNTLETLVGHLENSAEVIPELEELTSFFDTSFWVHFDKEERALFPEFDGVMPRGMGPLASMISEHGVIRQTYKVLRQAISEYFKDYGSPEIRESINRQSEHFIGLLRDHIRKEDSLLVQMTETYLGPDQSEKVIALFSEIENMARE